MILVVGGSNQGKLAWTLRNFGYKPAQVAEGENLALTLPLPLEKYLVWHHLEIFLRRVMQQEWPADKLEKLRAELLGLPENMVIICDSVGGGLVPVESFDRQWRELVGRVCCDLAAEASQVWRIFCGLPQRLK